MKTRTWFRLVLTASLAAGIFASGCANKTDTKTAEASPESAPVPAVTGVSEPVQKVPPLAPQFSPGIQEVVTLVQASVEESVILAYIDSSRVAYAPTADEIVYLNDIGLSANVISALMRRGQKLRDEGSGSEDQTVATVGDTGLEAANLPPPASVATTNEATMVAGVPAVVVNAEPSAEPPAPVGYTAPQPLVTINSFYDPLAPYGTWMQVPDYGWVWQPSVVTLNPDWRPYSDGGHWIYSDAGWYWMSDYSWGWAPFHYGRWQCNPRHGWIWVPDTVWGPSWVCWRRTPLYCGWAPLPPAAVYEYGRGFTYYGVTVGSDCDFGLGVGVFGFVQYQYFCSPNPRRHFVDGPQCHNLYRDSVVHNHYFLGPNKHIINEGADRDKVANFSRAELRKISIRDLPPGAGRGLKPDRIEKDGSSLVIYRPQLQHAVPPRHTVGGGAASAPTPDRREPGKGTAPDDRFNFREASLRTRAVAATPLNERPNPPTQTPTRSSMGESPTPATTGASVSRAPTERPSLSTRSSRYPLQSTSRSPDTRPRFSVSRPSSAFTAGTSQSGVGQVSQGAPAARQELENSAAPAGGRTPRFSVSNPRGTPSAARGDNYSPAFNRSMNAAPAANSSPGSVGAAVPATRQEPARSYSSPGPSYTPRTSSSLPVQRSEPVYSRPTSMPSVNNNNYRPSVSTAPSVSAPSSVAAPARPSPSPAPAPSVSFQSSGGSRSEPVRAAPSVNGSDPRRNGK